MGLPASLKDAYLYPIPKQSQSRLLTQMRPISLLEIGYKLTTGWLDDNFSCRKTCKQSYTMLKFRNKCQAAWTVTRCERKKSAAQLVAVLSCSIYAIQFCLQLFLESHRRNNSHWNKKT